MRECVKCKSNEYTNKQLVMMINECGHPLCRNCVENLFARNSAPCHICGRTLRKTGFWEQTFEDAAVEKETNIRRRLRKIYNLKLEDFGGLPEFNDYLERFEIIVANLACDIDVEETEAEIAHFQKENAELIDRNRKKLDADQLWVLSALKEERDMKARLTQMHTQENEKEAVEKLSVTDTKAIMEELKNSNVPAEVILDRERKRQIEQELLEKEEAEKRKLRNKELLASRKRQAETMCFTGGPAARISGRAFVYTPPHLVLGGPPMPTIQTMQEKGYASHMRAPSAARVAGGFTSFTGISRALFEARIDLLAC